MEETEMPGAIEFHERFVSKNKPVMFRDVMKNIPAAKTWTKDNYLKDK